MKRYAIILCVLLSCVACGHEKKTNLSDSKLSKQDLESLNRYMVDKDRERIHGYMERKDLSMEENPMGIWFSIDNEGGANKIKDNDLVTMEYDCSLLDGSVCYSSDYDGYKTIMVGKAEFGIGLDYGLKMLGEGGEATFIIPPFMAFGLKGDSNRIPSHSVLVFNIKVLKIN